LSGHQLDIILNKKKGIQLTFETKINDDLFRDYSKMVKEATALHKAGKLDEAVEKLKTAYKEADEKNLTLTVKDYLKLPPYLQKAKRNDEAWAWFNSLIQHASGDHMALSEIYDKMRLFRQRERQPKDAVKYDVLSRVYWCLGLYDQVTKLGWDERKDELENCKTTIGEGYIEPLKKASCGNLEVELKKLISKHMEAFPSIHLPDLVRDINGLLFNEVVNASSQGEK
jgi:tetratricopeptide (TPR) repeat protein